MPRMNPAADPAPPSFLRKLAPGLLLALSVALIAWLLAEMTWARQLGLSALTLAIVLGMLIGNIAYARLQPACDPGVDFAKRRLLRLGIILFGLRITFQDIAAVGMRGVLIDTVIVAGTFLLALWLGRRWLRMDESSAMLIGAGASVCGAAAVLAAEPVVKGGAERVAVAVATVVVFGTIAMFLYPFLYAPLQALGGGEAAYGIYVGSTVHEVAQVVVAGQAVSPMAAEQAVITKMIRVMMLAPFLLLLSAWLARRNAADAGAEGVQRLVIPWFAVGFIGVAAFNSLQLLPADLHRALLLIDQLLLATAMAALGLTTHASALRRAGTRPLALAALLFVWLVLGGALVNALLGGWLSL